MCAFMQTDPWDVLLLRGVGLETVFRGLHIHAQLANLHYTKRVGFIALIRARLSAHLDRCAALETPCVVSAST